MTLLLDRPSNAEAEFRRLRAEVARLKAELAGANAAKIALEAACHEDVVTALSNRRGFLRDLARALSFARRYKTPAALLMLDLDRFKPINDTYGHGAGDLALKHVADRLRDNLRASDSVGRIGGDEFGILLWQIDETTARQKADAIETVLDTAELAIGGDLIPVGGSIGVAMLQADDEVGSLLARADRAMYARKAERRAREGKAPLRR